MINMKQSILFFFAITLKLTAFSQVFHANDNVQVDTLLSEKEGKWQNGTVISFDSVKNIYTVKLSNGKHVEIRTANPEKWIRPVTNLNGPGLYGPSQRFPYQYRSKLMTGYDCRPSEKYIKKNIPIQIAKEFKDYSMIYVDVTSFKGQNGFDDKEHKGQQVYPFKIEMLVHLKRTITVRGKEYSEYKTIEFDRVYEYATRANNKCDFYPVPGSHGKLLFSGWY